MPNNRTFGAVLSPFGAVLTVEEFHRFAVSNLETLKP
jgi:hypothetical protein